MASLTFLSSVFPDDGADIDIAVDVNVDDNNINDDDDDDNDFSRSRLRGLSTSTHSLLHVDSLSDRIQSILILIIFILSIFTRSDTSDEKIGC